MPSENLHQTRFNDSNAKVGIVMPIWNQKKEYIYECLYSIEHQDFKDFKLVIVIDGADSETVTNVMSMCRQLSMPLLIEIRGFNKGIAFSLNEGFACLSNCKYLSWISSDNIYYPEFLSTLVAEMENSSEDTVLVYSTFNLIDKYSKKIENNNRIQYQIKFMNRPKEQILQNCFIGASFLFKNDAFKKCGNYNPEFETVEDYEFWIRLLQFGELKFISSPLMDYRLGGEFSYTTIIPSGSISIRGADASYKHRLLQNQIPDVTVIISVFNEGKYITQCIKSVLSQTHENFQLIVIDDGSTDDTWFYVNQNFDKRIMAISLDNNLGKSHVMNLALKYALGRYVLELDGDDWIEKNTLELMVNKMDPLPSTCALCYGNRKIWIETNGDLVEGPIYYGIEYKDKYEVIQNVTTQCPRMYRKECLNDVGGWPVNYINGERNIVEDLNLMLNLASKYSFCYINETLYNQRRHSNNLTSVNIVKCSNQIEELISRILVEWGNLYTPLFSYNGPWVSKVTLVPK